MIISYAITVCNEEKEIQYLISYLKKIIDQQDEIVVVYDKNRVTSNVLSILETEKVRFYPFDFKNNFLENKNYLNSLCYGEYIFQIDADEIPETTLVENLKIIIDSNNVDCYIIPRKNLVENLTPSHIKKWGWIVNEQGWVNWPDPQKRIYRNDPNIQWSGHVVHGMIEGYKTYAFLPFEEQWCINHYKTIDRQEAQNNRYDQIEKKQLL